MFMAMARNPKVNVMRVPPLILQQFSNPIWRTTARKGSVTDQHGHDGMALLWDWCRAGGRDGAGGEGQGLQGGGGGSAPPH